MSEEDLHTVLAHIEEDPNFARDVAADRRVLHRFMLLRQPNLHLTDEEVDNAVGQAIYRRDHPLTPEERRRTRNTSVPQAPCVDKREAVEDARRRLREEDPGATAVAVAATAAGFVGAALTPAGPGQTSAYTGAVVLGAGGVHQVATRFIEHTRALRRALAQFHDCLARNRLRADADRLGATIAAIDGEIAQLTTRAGVA